MDIDYQCLPRETAPCINGFNAAWRVAKQPLDKPTRGKSQADGPEEKIEKLDTFAKDFLELARKDRLAQYVSADANIQKAFNLEPGLKEGDWGVRQKRLAAVITGLKLADIQARELTLSKDAEQSNTGAEAIAAYLEGRDLRAILLAHAALGANMRGDAMFEELLYIMSDLVKIHVRRDEILPKEALIKEKLRKAAKGFYMKLFDVAARECEEVAVLDEENPVAWTRLGSAYFMLGDKEKAKKAYRKALEIDPNDMVTGKFMDAQGWR